MAIKPDGHTTSVSGHSIAVGHYSATVGKYSTLNWRTSSASIGAGECVEIAKLDSFVLARDSKNRADTVLEFTSAQWLGLIQRIKDGDAVHR